MWVMTHSLRLAVILCLAGFPAVAQDDPATDGNIDQGMTLLQEGAQLLLRGLLDEVEPTLDDLGARAEELAQEMEPAFRLLTEEMGPAVAALLSRIDDIRNYEAPVFLENGDIIIRRKPDAPPYAAPEPEPAAPGEIEL
jgi:hypothetical protein